MRLVINEAQATIIREAAQRVIERGETASRIAMGLNTWRHPDRRRAEVEAGRTASRAG